MAKEKEEKERKEKAKRDKKAKIEEMKKAGTYLTVKQRAQKKAAEERRA